MLITARGIGMEWKMRSTLGTSEHNSGASICFYAASKNVSEELVMITPRHFLGLKKKKNLQGCICQAYFQTFSSNMHKILQLSARHRRGVGVRAVNLTIKLNLYLGGEKGS